MLGLFLYKARQPIQLDNLLLEHVLKPNLPHGAATGNLLPNKMHNKTLEARGLRRGIGL
jgi:hypothetical protein